MVGRVLTETQTGYTLGTQYTALAQIRKGLPVSDRGQAGITEQEVEQTEHYVHGGVDYYLLPGVARNELLLDEWLAENIRGLAQLVVEIRPSVLHAQSDFFDALIVHAVGTKYSIPTVYRLQGLLGDVWLSRTIDANGWGDGADILFSMYGLPDAYSLEASPGWPAAIRRLALAAVRRAFSAHARIFKIRISGSRHHRPRTPSPGERPQPGRGDRACRRKLCRHGWYQWMDRMRASTP